MFSSNLLLVLFTCGLLQESWARYISLSLNLSMSTTDERPKLSADMLRSCMKETELSMAELNRFSVHLLSNDPDVVSSIEDGIVNAEDDDINQYNVVDYDGSPALIREKNEESLQCFAHCLYEELGLVKNGVFVEHDLFRKLYTVMETEKTEVKECMNMESSNKCEAAYRMHMCYSRLKSLEAERRIREILEYSDNTDDDGDDVEEGEGELDCNGLENGGDAIEKADPKKNEI